MSAVPATWAPSAATRDAQAGWRYGALGFPLAFLSLPLYVLLPSHYAVRHGMALAALGLILLATRSLDAIVDPFVGRAVDAVFARSARLALRLAAAAACVLALGFAALFTVSIPPGWEPTWLVAGLLTTYLAFSVLTIVHQTWGVRLGGDAAQRTRLVAWREGCGSVGLLVGSVLPSVGGMGVSCLALAATLAAGMALLARTTPPAPGAAVQAVAWTQPWRGGRFRRLIAAFMFNGIATAVPATLVVFFAADRLQAPDAMALFLGAYFAAAILSVPGWVRVVHRFGLTPTWLAGMGMSVAAFAWTAALGAGDLRAFFLVCLASGVALGADLTIPGSLLSGVVQRSGHSGSAEGVYVGWWNCATKLNLGLAAGAALPLLAAAGYAPGQRDAASLAALSLAYVVVPCALKLIAAAFLWRGWIQTGEDE